MLTSDFDYAYPQKLIAQQPANPRDSSRLLVYHKDSGQIEHKVFRDVVEYLHAGDTLVVNSSKVIPARLFGKKATGGKVEVLLLRKDDSGRDRWRPVPTSGTVWRCLTKPGLKTRDVVVIGETSAHVMGREQEEVVIEFDCAEEGFDAWLQQHGEIPLPPYITDHGGEKQYQTVYAQKSGSAAAPTAGLHFTPELLDALRAKGVRVVGVTLHVGLGTFQLIKTEAIEDFQIHSEYAEVTEDAVREIVATQQRGGRIVAVGTTSLRTLEGLIASQWNDLQIAPKAVSGWVSIYITPGYQFQLVDGLITNFHVPQSSLLVLVASFVGEDWKKIYAEAIQQEYRLFSFGDASLLI